MKKYLLLSFISISVFAEAELKTILNPVSYNSFINILKSKGLKPKLKVQTNNYFDTKNFILKHNGIGLRIRLIEGKPAELTLKNSSTFTPNIFLLDSESGNTSILTNKDEYECLFKKESDAIKIIKDPKKIFEVDDKTCKTIKESHFGIHPIDFLKQRLKNQPLFEIKNDKKVVKNNAYKQIKKQIAKMAQNKNIRNVFEFKYGKNKLKMEVDHTVYNQNTQSFGADFDVTKIVGSKYFNKIQNDFINLITMTGQQIIPPLTGKTSRTFILSLVSGNTLSKFVKEQKEASINRLLTRGELLKK